MRKLLAFTLLFVLLFTSACSSSQNESSAPETTESSLDTSVVADENEDNNPSEARYVDFVAASYEHDALHKFPETYPEGTNVVFIDSYEVFTSFCDEHKFHPGEEFKEEFFEENSVIFGFFVAGSGSIEFSIKNIYVNTDNKVTVKISHKVPQGQTSDLQTTTLAAKVKKTDLATVSGIECIYETQGNYGYSFEEDILPNGEEFVSRNFKGNITNSSLINSCYGDVTYVEWIEIANDKYELSQIADRYVAPTNESQYTEFSDYISQISDNFFEENILVAIPYSGKYNNTIIELVNVEYADDCVAFDIMIDNRGATAFEDFENIIIVEIPKNRSGENPNYSIRYKHHQYEYNGKLDEIDYTPYVFKVDIDTTKAKNTALDDLEYDEPAYKALYKEELMWTIRDNMQIKEPYNEEFVDFLDQFDDEFFKDKGLLISYKIFVDKGESVIISSVKRVQRTYGIAIEVETEIADTVKPSSNEDLDCYVCFAIIDKNELVGMMITGNVIISNKAHKESQAQDYQIEGDIDFKSSNHSNGYYDGKDKVQLIKTHSELLDFYKENGVAITDGYEEEYFKDKALVLSLITCESGSIELEISRLQIKNGVLQVRIDKYIPEVMTHDTRQYFFAIEVSQKDVEGITEAKIVFNNITEEEIILN